MLNFLFSIENTLNDKILGGLRGWVVQTKSLWLPPLIIVSILLLSAILPFRASQRHFVLLIGLFVSIGVILLIIRWPLLGLLAVIGSIIIPFDGPSGLNATMAVVGLVLGLWLLNMMVIQREIKLVPSKTIPPLLVFVTIAIMAFGVGQLPWYTFAQSAPMGAQLGALSVFVLSAGAFLLVAHYVRDLRWLAWMTWLFLILCGLYIAGRIVPGFNFNNYLFTRFTTGSLFFTWLVALAFSQAIFNRNLHLGWRLALGVLVCATFYVGYFQNEDWKSGWIPPLFAIIAIFGVRFWRISLLLSPLGIIPLSRLISYGIASDEYSYSTRIDAWTIVLEIAKVNPILGLGPANYRWYTPLFPIRGWSVYFNSHSQYVDLIAQTGLLGLAGLVWFFGSVGWLGWQLLERVPAGFARAYVYGALGGLVGTLVAGALGDWILPFFYNVGLKGFRASVLAWLFLGGVVALEQMYVSNIQVTSEE